MTNLPPLVSKLIDIAIEEDLGPGDVTTRALGLEGDHVSGSIIAREPCVVCGLTVAETVFARLDSGVGFAALVDDGSYLGGGETMAELEGPASSILAGERTALNFLQRMCGIATLARSYTEKAAGRAVVLDSRKTVPGWRWLDKLAVRTGGCRNHRMGLYDGILIKDNHIKACGSISEAISRARTNSPPGTALLVEVDSLEGLQEALSSGVDTVMLDNFSPEAVGHAVEIAAGRVQIEVSGGVSLENIESYLQTEGIHFISVGGLTHSVRAVDISLEFR
ncbi:MAG: carboxylating nicotinate-nucleotide diphosphorylase [bacterium]|nr:MAG: carboxylating nicotinate-nucleotide diphosphorylase [bacterium]